MPGSTLERVVMEELPLHLPPRCIHVWFPGLEQVRAGHKDFPVQAVRERASCDFFTLWNKVVICGHSFLVNEPEKPLSGTGGRATCLIHTHAKLICYGPRDYSFNAVLTKPEAVVGHVLWTLKKKGISWEVSSSELLPPRGNGLPS